MKKQHLTVSVLTLLTSLVLCSCQSPYSLSDMWSNDSSPIDENTNLYYPESEPNQSNTNQTTTTSKPLAVATQPTHKVAVPQSYYLAEGHPVSHQTADKNWVESQESSEYTIQLANNEKASSVANILQKAPKNERMAQVEYDANGQIKYVGVYGTYPNKEAAEVALNKLPPEMRKKAKVKSWSNIQEKANSVPKTASDDNSIALPTLGNPVDTSSNEDSDASAQY